ncbi:MAG TPA: NAD(P)H-hydrate epimerase [Humisphaera sp.]|nr:NAD(P)H-hydrate epimerase [Humisphaera sp.]
MYLSRNQLRQIDRLAAERYHIPGIVLMENAARAATDVAMEMLADPRDKQVLILCGGGNNGGDGLAIARHLHNRGSKVQIALTIDPQRYQNEALVNWKIISAMNFPVAPATAGLIETLRANLILDAIFGTGLTQPPRPPFADLALAVNRSGKPVLAVDIPSGLDCDTGQPLGECIRATRTITFAAQKLGFARAEAQEFLGTVTVGDIGCPSELVSK